MGELATTNNLLNLIESAATNQAVDADKMMKIIDAQERIHDKNAQIAFNKAMTACQKSMPTVIKDADNTQTNSQYARYETIISTTKGCYTEHGFSLSFGTDESPKEGHVRVTCDVMHEQGHTKNYFADLPLDMNGIKGSVNKTEIHATASTYSYAKRYLFCMIFNIAVEGQDDDANKAGGVNYSDLLEFVAFVRDNFEQIHQVKSGIANEDLYSASTAFNDFSTEEKRYIWKAPSKGGIFTTYEREVMKTPAFREAAQP